MSGTLFLCATPIGNREDITYRTVKALENADLIAAEDTRHSLPLLEYYGVRKELTSYHEHNKYEKAEELIGRLKEGANVCLITDAGTPVISDPGEVLVRRAIEEGIPVTSLPGPCALITGLTLSGLSGRRFAFEGFLPQETKERKERLAALVKEERTIILYEAPHRLKKTLGELSETLGGSRKIACARELTKIHEEVLRLTLAEAAAYFEAHEPRGEFVLILEGRPPEEARAEEKAKWESLTPEEHLNHYLAQGLDRKEALKKTAEDRGMNRKELYRLLFVGEKEE